MRRQLLQVYRPKSFFYLEVVVTTNILVCYEDEYATIGTSNDVVGDMCLLRTVRQPVVSLKT